jgi:hypothetical protein
VNYLASDRRYGGKARLAGLSLHATEANVVIEDGDRVEGPAVSLLIAATWAPLRSG